MTQILPPTIVMNPILAWTGWQAKNYQKSSYSRMPLKTSCFPLMAKGHIVLQNTVKQNPFFLLEYVVIRAYTAFLISAQIMVFSVPRCSHLVALHTSANTRTVRSPRACLCSVVPNVCDILHCVSIYLVNALSCKK